MQAMPVATSSALSRLPLRSRGVPRACDDRAPAWSRPGDQVAVRRGRDAACPVAGSAFAAPSRRASAHRPARAPRRGVPAARSPSHRRRPTPTACPVPVFPRASRHRPGAPDGVTRTMRTRQAAPPRSVGGNAPACQWATASHTAHGQRGGAEEAAVAERGVAVLGAAGCRPADVGDAARDLSSIRGDEADGEARGRRLAPRGHVILSMAVSSTQPPRPSTDCTRAQVPRSSRTRRAVPGVNVVVWAVEESGWG